jgi:amino acid adenylation domain-containing protein
VILNQHHIVSDGWSLGVLVEELTARYRALAAGERPALPDLPVQYADYAVWQRRWLAGEVLAARLRWWGERLAGAPHVLDLPTDRPRPIAQSLRGAHQGFAWPTGISAALREISRRQGATLFMTLASLLAALLSRQTGAEDFLLGSPVAGRDQPETERLIGLFVNTLVLRAELAGDPSFSEILGRMREMALGAYAHQDLPFEKLVDSLQTERSLSVTPLFQVMLALQNAPLSPCHLPGLTLAPFPFEKGTARFDLLLSMAEAAGRLTGDLEYDRELFDAATIARLLGHLRILAESAIDRPEAMLSELPLLSAPEIHQLGREWNDTAAPRPAGALIHALFAARAAESPHAPALVCEDRVFTYAGLDRVTDRLAGRLRALGVGPDRAVGVLMERSVEMVVALLGTLKAGAAYLALDPEHPPERLAWMLMESCAPVVLAQEALLPRLPAHGSEILCLEAGWTGGSENARVAEPDPPEGVAADHLAYLLYTSGSTGRPKGVMISHRGIVNRLLWMQETYGLTPEDRVLQKTPFGFDVSVWEFFWPLIAGSCLVIASPGGHRDAAYLAGLIARERITVIHFVPSMLQAFLDQPDLSGCPSLRLVVASGEALSPELRRRCQERLPARLENLYGPTEASVDVTAWSCAGVPREGVVPIGRPVANTGIHLLDRSFRPIPIGVAGELCIGGVQLARGYWRRPDLTAERFVPDPYGGSAGGRLYRTGDLARHLPDGSIEFLGRIDHQVKIRGFRIELGEIEAALLEEGRVKQALVVARQDGPSPRLLAYVVPAEGEPASPSVLREALLARLPAYMVPAAWVVLPSLPLTANGKVDRRALPEPEAPSGSPGHTEPGTSVEQVLAAVWAEVLRVEKVGLHDNFFALGGDSILSIQICARAQKAGVRISPRLLFQHQTVATLAAVANTMGVLETEQGLVTGPAPLTPVQRWFFEDPTEPHHFNQSLLFETTGSLDPVPLRAALERLERHHDALRLRFFQGPAGWRQAGGLPAPCAPLLLIDLADLPAPARPRAVEDAAAQAQASLDLQRGPLYRALLLDFGTQEPGRFFWTIHHLVVDGVSWRILLEDLTALYHGFARSRTAELPAKTTSFRHWAERLAAHAEAPETEAELSLWLHQAWAAASRLPLDRPQGIAANVVASESSVSLQLDAAETRALLQEVPQAYNTRINDVLLSALASGFRDWTGSPVLLVDLEGHGREEIFPDVDLSRTVGWLTSIYPVLLDVREAPDPPSSLKASATACCAGPSATPRLSPICPAPRSFSTTSASSTKRCHKPLLSGRPASPADRRRARCGGAAISSTSTAGFSVASSPSPAGSARASTGAQRSSGWSIPSPPGSAS